MRRKGRGHIRQRKSGRFNSRIMGFNLGMFDTLPLAEQAITDFLGDKCPWCRQSLPSTGVCNES